MAQKFHIFILTFMLLTLTLIPTIHAQIIKNTTKNTNTNALNRFEKQPLDGLFLMLLKIIGLAGIGAIIIPMALVLFLLFFFDVCENRLSELDIFPILHKLLRIGYEKLSAVLIAIMLVFLFFYGLFQKDTSIDSFKGINPFLMKSQSYFSLG